MKKITSLWCLIILILLSIQLNAQVYQTLQVQNGFTDDVIAETSPANTTTTTAVDATGNGANNAFMSIAYPGATVGLPTSGLINSIATTGLSFQLASYTANNSLRINTNGGQGTLVFQNLFKATKVYILTTSGSATSTFTGIITFNDNSTQNITSQTVPDWYQAGAAAIQGIGRVPRGGGNPDNNTTNPKIFQIVIDIAVANQNKEIKSIQFTKTSSDSGFLNVFAVSVEVLPTCPSPSTATPTIVSSTEVNISWTAPAIVPQNGYEYELRTSGAAGSGSTGLVSGTSTTNLTANFNTLQPSTAYSFYIRSICTSENGVWKLASTFNTPCAIGTVPFFEGFEVGYTNSTSVGGCWTQVTAEGTQTWTANNTATDYNRSPRTGAWNAYLRYSNEDWMFYPVQLAAGTNYQLKFYARQDGSTASDASVKARVGTTNTVAGMTIPVVPETTIINGAYKEIVNYFTVPTSGVYYVGINGKINGNPWYISIDDISLIVAPTCFEPTNVSFSNITKNSVDISWTAPTQVIPSNGYQYEIRTSGAAGSGTTGLAHQGTTAAGITTANVAGVLAPGTTYSVYVRSVCGTNDLSVWTLVKTFTTICNYPDIVSTTPDTICGVGSGELSATSTEGIIQWFNSLTGAPLYTGNDFTTPEVSETTTFYVRSGIILPNQNVQVGLGTTASTDGGQSPFYYSYGGYKHQYIFTAQELIAAGLSAGNINSIGFDIVTGSTVNRNNFTIHMGTTTQNDATSTHIANLTQVYSNAAQPMTVGISSYAFTSPYAWDGVSNIVVQINWSNNNWGDYTQSGSVRYHTTASPKCTYTYADTVTAAQLLATMTGSVTTWNGGTFTSTSRANTYFNGNAICASPKQPVVLTVTPPAELTLSTTEIDVCQGNDSELITVTTGAADYDTYVWTPEEGVSGDAATGWMISPQASGVYTLRASQSNGACVLDVPVQVNVSEIGYDDLDEEYIVCKDNILELSVEADSSAKIILGAYPFNTTPVVGFTHNSVSGTTTVAANTTVFTEGNGSIRFSHASSSNGKLTLTNSINGSGSGDIIVEFDNIALIEGGGWDYGFVEYSLNNGTSWTAFTPAQYVGAASTIDDTSTAKRFTINSYQAWESAGTSTQPANSMWKTERFVLSSTIGDLSQIKIRFALISDSSFNYYGWLLDNVKIFKETIPTTSWEGDHLYLDAAATQSYSGENTQTVYFKHTVEGEYPVSVTISNSAVNCEATTTTTVKIPTIVLPSMNNQVYCEPTAVGDLIFDRIDGYVYTWHSSATSTATISTISTSGTYYLEVTSNEGNCKAARVPVEIIIAQNLEAVVNPSYTFCDQATFADINVGTQYGAGVQWFASADSTTVLDPSTSLTSTTYYVALAINNCVSTRKPVNVTILQTPAPIAAQQAFTVCYNTSLSTLNVGASDTKWYYTQTSTTALGTSAIAQNNTYYVVTYNGICESARIPVVVNVVQQLQMPTASPQSFCVSGTVSQLVATGAVTGAEYVWYASASSTTPLQPSAALQSGTYYVIQKLTGCESPRRAVTVHVTNLTAPQTTSFEFCGNATVADLHMPALSGVTYNWYLPNGTTPLTGTTPLSTGNYYVSKSQNGCESAKTIVQVTMKPRPSSPTGSTTQNFVDSAVLSELVMNQLGVIWYVTYEDAINGVNPLPPNMPLEDGHTYYGVLIGSNGCASLPTAVNVVITLGVKDLDLASLKYYPNPVNSELTVTYKDPIKLIEVYDLLGKQVKVQKFDSTDVRLDVSSLSSGTYMLRVQTDSGSQFIKVIKN